MKPQEKVPHLELDLINGTKWSMKNQAPEKYTMIIFYRGLHCPVCKKQLENLKKQLNEFVNRGVNVIAVSMDTEKRAKIAGKEWNISSIPVGYEMNEETARNWGLYLSKGVSDKEPALFSEPGMFLINKDGSLYCSSVQTMPFTRPSFDDLLKAIDFIQDKGYPARGEA